MLGFIFSAPTKMWVKKTYLVQKILGVKRIQKEIVGQKQLVSKFFVQSKFEPGKTFI